MDAANSYSVPPFQCINIIITYYYNYLRLIYAQFLRHFLIAILLFLVLGCIIIIISISIMLYSMHT